MPNKFWLLKEGPPVLSSFLPLFRTQVSNLGFLDPPLPAPAHPSGPCHADQSQQGSEITQE